MFTAMWCSVFNTVNIFHCLKKDLHGDRFLEPTTKAITFFHSQKSQNKNLFDPRTLIIYLKL